MSTGAALLGIALAAACAAAAVAALRDVPGVRDDLDRLGVGGAVRAAIPAALLAGAAGLLVGVHRAGIGVIAALGLFAYFALAVAVHLRRGDGPADAAPAAVLALTAGTVAILA